jgi:predicted ATP-grasp superfamily ATP-dependent carboligase
LILGGAATALSVARSLGRAGIAVDAFGERLVPPAVRWSRYARSYREVPPTGAVQSHWAAMLEQHRTGAVVFPCGDEGLEFVARNRSMLLDLGFRPIPANDALVLAMLDKAKTSELAMAAGVEVPQTATVASEADVDAAIGAFAFPCALKPLHSHEFSRHFSGKAIVVWNADEMREAFRGLVSSGVQTMITEIIPGIDDSYCSYYSWFDENSEALLHFTKRKLRQFPIGFGTGTFHETVWEPDAAEIGYRLFKHVRLRGLGNVEFKRDARDGRLKLIECNLRFTAANELVRRAGTDLALIAYCDATDQTMPAVDEFRAGLHQWHPTEDVRAFLAYRSEGRLTSMAWARSVARPQCFPTFAFRDPLPALRGAPIATRRAVRWMRARHTGKRSARR